MPCVAIPAPALCSISQVCLISDRLLQLSRMGKRSGIPAFGIIAKGFFFQSDDGQCSKRKRQHLSWKHLFKSHAAGHAISGKFVKTLDVFAVRRLCAH